MIWWPIFLAGGLLVWILTTRVVAVILAEPYEPDPIEYFFAVLIGLVAAFVWPTVLLGYGVYQVASIGSKDD